MRANRSGLHAAATPQFLPIRPHARNTTTGPAIPSATRLPTRTHRPEPADGYGRDPPPRSVAFVNEDLQQSRARISVAKWLGITVAVVVGIPVLLVLGVLVTYGIQRATPEDYPKVDPQTMVDRAGARSQKAYDVLGFDATLPPGEFNSLSAGYCYPDGLESAADESVDGAYALSHNWLLTDVTKSEDSRPCAACATT